MKNLAVRWTIGDVSSRGFDVLALSIRGVTSLFPDAEFVVSVNSVSLEEAKQRTGKMSARVNWVLADGHIHHGLRAHTDNKQAEGVAWKLAPVRLFPDRHELSLDNDIVLWDVPSSMAVWLAEQDSCLIAEDLRPAFGKFSDLCGSEPRNSGIRGLPPGFDLESELLHVLNRHPTPSSMNKGSRSPR